MHSGMYLMNWEYHLHQKVRFPRDFRNISCPGIRNGILHTKHMITIISKGLLQICICDNPFFFTFRKPGVLIYPLVITSDFL